jgi:hypothetical protein
MKKYRLTEDGVQNTKTTAFIPNDERNNDWVEYQNWLKGFDVDGEDLGIGKNTPDPQFTAEELVEQTRQEEIKINEQKIQTEMIKIAIENLKASGNLPVDYKE